MLTACNPASNLPPLHPPDFTAEMPTAPPATDAEDVEAPITPQFGGHLNIAMPMPQTLNPLLNSDPALAQVLRLIFEPIVIFDDENLPMPNPAIIESIVFAPSGQSLTIALRDGIFWEDGTPITSSDIAFSINVLRHNAPATAVYRPNVAHITSTNTTGDKMLHINLAAPMWQMMYLLDFPIIPAHYYTGVSTTNLTAARNMHPVGNGAFRFYEYVLANRLELMANDNAPLGRPYIDRITAIVLRDINDADHAFSQGLIDVFVADHSNWGRYRSLGRNLAANLSLQNLDFIAFNHNRTIFAEPLIRQAIANAPDVEAFVQAGFARDAQGILHRQLSPALPSVPLALTIIANEENVQATANAQSLYRNLVNAGVAVTLHILPAEFFAIRLAQFDFDLAVGTVTLDNPSNYDFIRSFGYSASEFGAIQFRMRSAVSYSEFAQTIADLRQYVEENLPFIELNRRGDVLFTTSRLHGDFSTTINDIFRNIENWFLVD